MNLQTSYSPSAHRFGMIPPPVEAPSGIESVVLRHLQSHDEIRAVLHLRDEIDLSAHSGSADFISLEKKETK
jgi:hypothetical protein